MEAGTMRSALTQMSTKLGITDVRDVQVGEVVDDGAGGFVRAIRIFGEPAASAGPALILEIQIQSDTKTDLDITTPTLSF
jgi:hypothetical protein